MKVCFPVKDSPSLESEVYGHFGSAPSFVLVDTETNNLKVIGNADQHHTHGMCSPLKALGGHDIDCVVVGGIGGGALMKLNQSGIKVYKATARTVGENLDLFTAGNLSAFVPGHVCGGHANGSACSHH
ncbi:MAG: diguanylate cyclase [Nitrospirae bacterium]|nr:diguanylate cyclase [Nitrospirota bacterium]